MLQSKHAGQSAKQVVSDRSLSWLRAALIALIATLFLTNQASALDPNRAITQAMHRIWQVQQGLPQATIFSIRQTHDGYLWLGTQKGLVRFDGARFTSVRSTSGRSLDNLWIRDLEEDADHNLWIATAGAGLIRLDRNLQAKSYTTPDGLPGDDVRALLADRKGSLWAATDKGLARFDQGRLTVFHHSDGLPTEDLWALCQASNGTIWIGGESGTIASWDGSRLATRRLKSLPGGASVRALCSASDDAIWIGTTAGLVRLSGHDEHRVTKHDGLADDRVYCLAEGRDGSLWAGTKDGFNRLPPKNGAIQSFGTRDGLSQSTVNTLYEDREGSLWVGTKHGLNQFLDRRSIPFTEREGLPSNDTGPVLQDRTGRIWVGTLGAGLAHYDGRHFAALAGDAGLPSNTILALADGGSEGLWVGTDQGLCLLHDEHVAANYSTAEGLPSAIVQCVYRDRAGRVWAGTSAGLAELRDGRFVEPATEDGPLRSPVLALAEDSGQSLLVATEGHGVYRYVDGRLKPIEGLNASAGDGDAFYCDAEGRVWLGTRDDGLWLLDGAKTIHYTVKDGLHDDDIFGIVADDQDRLWMACSKGIFYVARADLKKFAAGQSTSITCRPFSPTEAQRTIESKDGVQPAVWKMQDGRIWFSTIRGLSVVDPTNTVRSIPPIPVVVEDVIVNGQAESLQQVALLPPGRTNLTFRYTALSFLVPTRTTFRYKLEGYDRDWVDAGSRREAFYTNLPPGSYEFRVAARSVDEAYHEAAQPLALTIEPYFYQTVWFLPVCVALAAAGVWAAYRMRVRRIKERMHVVVVERSRIARELHDTLMQGFSGVTMELQALWTRLAPSPERASLEEIIRDAGVCLREARRSVAGLRNPGTEETGLAGAIAQAARHLTETRDVRLRLRVERVPNLATEVEYNLLRIAQEAISNAIKHAGASTVEVSLEASADELQLAIKDDGHGFQLDDAGRSPPGHYGLIGMRERANQIGAELHIESEPGRGATISAVLPLREGSGARRRGSETAEV
jgi:signal transduction histidine kinase/ligand-binding sensor domain-containing protein